MTPSPVFRLAAPGHSLPSGGFGESSRTPAHGPAWPSQGLVSPWYPHRARSWPPTCRWTSLLLPVEVSCWLWGCRPRGIPHTPNPPVYSSACSPFLVKRWLHQEMVTPRRQLDILHPEPVPRAAQHCVSDAAPALLAVSCSERPKHRDGRLPASQPAVWTVIPPTDKAGNYCVFWMEEKTPPVFYVLRVLALM